MGEIIMINWIWIPCIISALIGVLLITEGIEDLFFRKENKHGWQWIIFVTAIGLMLLHYSVILYERL
jgi:uncharacterized membrane protein HdeD (DUF308 family)